RADDIQELAATHCWLAPPFQRFFPWGLLGRGAAAWGRPSAELAGSSVYAARSELILVRFLRRHVFSLSLGALSAMAFLRLGLEVSKGELGAFDETMTRVVAGFRGRLDW